MVNVVKGTNFFSKAALQSSGTAAIGYYFARHVVFFAEPMHGAIYNLVQTGIYKLIKALFHKTFFGENSSWESKLVGQIATVGFTGIATHTLATTLGYEVTVAASAYLTGALVIGLLVSAVVVKLFSEGFIWLQPKQISF